MQYLMFFCLLLELFRECGICCFSVRYWSCSDSMVFVVFLLDIGAVPTVRICCFYVRYWSCSDSAVFVVFLLDIGAVPTVRYLCFSVRY